jgi:hypothetical protein
MGIIFLSFSVRAERSGLSRTEEYFERRAAASDPFFTVSVPVVVVAIVGPHAAAAHAREMSVESASVALVVFMCLHTGLNSVV